MESSRTAEGRVRRPLARLVAIGVAAAMAVALLPGVAAAVTYPYVSVVPSATTAVPGQAVKFQAVETTGLNTTVDVTHVVSWTINDLGAVPCAASGVFEICTPSAVGTWVVAAALAGSPILYGYATMVVSPPAPGAAVGFDVDMSAHFLATTDPLYEPGPPVKNYPEVLGVADTATVCAVDTLGNTVPGYTGTVRFTSSDSRATLPANYTFTSGDAGCHKFSVTFGTLFDQSLTVNDIATPLGYATAIWGQTTVHVAVANSYLYTPLIAPARLLDTRSGNGLTGVFQANTPRTFLVAGRGGVPWCATAVTGNITVTDETAGWAVYLGPDSNPAPTSSTINFIKGEVVANSLTVALSNTGYLSATYISVAGNTTNLVFDVTGYYGCADSDLYFHPITPTRVLDTRNNTGGFGGFAGKLTANTPATFQVTNNASHTTGVPTSAIAVTGNLTVTNETAGWAIYLGPVPQALPTSSTINFTTGQVLANGVTVGLGSGGTLSATYVSFPGNTTDLVFDVTGYYATDCVTTAQLTNATVCNPTGMEYVPITPVRILDTRVTGPALHANAPQPFQVSGQDAIPWLAAGAVTGNVTVTDETAGWALYVGAAPMAAPTTSNINFVAGEIRANGMTAGIHQFYPWPAGELGQLNATYMSSGSNTTNMVFDVTGYFIPAVTPIVSPVTPVIVTKPSKGVAIGGTISDTATFYGANNPTGTVTFRLYGPGDVTCLTPIAGATSLVSLVDGLTATSASFDTTGHIAGTYRWTVEYLGDVNNKAVPESTCGAETVTIWTPLTPTLQTTANPTSGVIGSVLNDAGTLTLGASPTGQIIFKLYGPTDGTCSAAPIYAQAVAVSSGSATTSPGYTTTAAGTYHWTATYDPMTDPYNFSTGPTACNAEPVVIKATPNIVTTASAGGSLTIANPWPLNDVATLTAGSGGVLPTGSVTFNLFSNATCSSPVLASGSGTVNAGGVATLATPYPANAGSYSWLAYYNGDANNTPVVSTCEVVTPSVTP
jgi:hypothetical protein